MVQNESVTADTQPSYDLPVSPISHLLLTLKFAQNLANTQATLANILAMLDCVDVAYKGSSIVTVSGADLFAVNILVNKFRTWGVNAKGDDNELRSFTWAVPFGRRLYNPGECYPGVKKGELVIQVSYASSFTNIDGVSLQLESVELPGAAASRFLKVTTKCKTPEATGQCDIGLPIGNKISDVILFGTTIPAADAATRTIQNVEIRKSNSEHQYCKTNFETLHNMAGRIGGLPGDWGSHIHQCDGAAYAQYMDISAVKQADHPLAHYLHLPFDIHGDGEFGLDTSGAESLVVRIDAGDTEAIRCLPCELVAAG